MGHKNRPTLVKQVEDKLKGKLAIGQSKHKDKEIKATHDRIYSYNTLKSYMKHCCYFVKWCKEKYGCKTLEECKEHINAWLETRADLSPYTRKLDVAAICKLYGLTAKDLRPTPARRRPDIKRSRGTAARDQHFSESRNAEFVSFCRCTGLRRSEIKFLRGDQLKVDRHGNAFINVKGKGGRKRKALIIGTAEEKAAIIARMQQAGSGRVWANVPNGADVHGYRADYAAAVYKMFARDIDSLGKEDLYICRKDRAGLRYDEKAMIIASEMLGHSRTSVIAYHYLHGLNR